MTIQRAFSAISRISFIPDVVWIRRDDGWLIPVRRQDDPERWEEICASDDAVITQVDDRNAADKGFWPTSSSSSPSLMATMLEHSRVSVGMRVLEIGTGTGYNAALLAYLVGTENVTTVEVDSDLAERARESLTRAGYPVKVVTGDGVHGYAENAPYDRLIATAAVREIPYAWVDQVTPGGLIVAPWALTIHPEAPFAVLTVRKDGTAEGRFVEPSGFMPLRSHRVSQEEIRRTDEAWIKAGKPDCTRYGITVTREGQCVWLDSPDGEISA